MMKDCILSAVLLGCILTNPCRGAERKFTSADGKELVAEIVKATEAEVTLKKSSDGKEYTLPLVRLSESDREFVAAWLARKKSNIRAAREVELSLEDGAKKKEAVPAGEYLSPDGTLTLYPGDTLHLEFEKEGEKWGKPAIVAEVTHPERTVTFSMSQGDETTKLNRTTKMQETVALDCEYCPVGSKEFSRTVLMPSEKGVASSDSWPNTVWILRLSNFEVSNRPAPEVYQERANK